MTIPSPGRNKATGDRRGSSLRGYWALLVVALGMSGMDLGSSAHAQSLWAHRVADKSHLYLDTQAREVGDLLTVVVREATGVENRDQRNLGKKNAHRGGLTLGGSLGGILGTADGEAEATLGLSDQRSMNDATETRIEREFLDQITVRVVDRLPNGNLVIRGTRAQKVTGEIRDLEVCGEIRPRDIGPDNTIESRFIANFQMRYLNSGDDVEFLRRGWLGRWWQKCRP